MMMLEFLILPIVLIALAVWAVPSLRGIQHPPTQTETPLEILRRRYASGEINQEEFEQAKRALA